MLYAEIWRNKWCASPNSVRGNQPGGRRDSRLIEEARENGTPITREGPGLGRLFFNSRQGITKENGITKRMYFAKMTLEWSSTKWKNEKKRQKNPIRMRFELTRGNPNGLAVHRLNHSATWSRSAQLTDLVLSPLPVVHWPKHKRL